MGPWDGLIIDDFVSLSVEPATFVPGGPSGSLAADAKDVLAQRVFKVAGAVVDSGPETVREGKTIIGAPVEKRLALAAASLRAASLPCISEELGFMLDVSPLPHVYA